MFEFISEKWSICTWGLKMNGYEEEAERLPMPLEPFQPKRPWPTPTPGVPFPGSKEEEARVLKQILEKLDDIDRRLEKIEKLLAKKFGTLP
jgi:hypothetical protein